MPAPVALLCSVPAEVEDVAVALLWEAGTLGVEVKPAGPRVDLLAYFTDAAAETLVRAALALLPSASVTATEVPDVDWVARFRETFRAFEVGSFRVIPVWDTRPPGGRVLVVDPGRAFGTGTHESTRLCLRALEAAPPAGRRVLDVGTGTGLLAVAAWKLGAAAVVAGDLDPEATASAIRHAALNEATVHVVQADGARAFRVAAFDLVLANLMAPLLLERREELCARLVRGGRLVMAGLLVSDLPDVQGAYGAHGPTSTAIDGEWASLAVEVP